MTLHDAFLQTILANPEDDTPRLVYSDWLDERGDPRGEFIRVQCRLAMLSADDERRPPLEQQERQLLERHQDQWLGLLRPLLDGWAFRRGFLDAVRVPAASYLRHTSLPLPATVRRVEVDLAGFEVPADVLEWIPASVAYENVLLPVGFRGGTLVLAVQNPPDPDIVDRLPNVTAWPASAHRLPSTPPTLPMPITAILMAHLTHPLLPVALGRWWPAACRGRFSRSGLRP